MKTISRICIINSSYSLLIYLLLSTKTEIESTFFFWSNGIPEQVRKYYKNSYTFDSRNSNNSKWYKFLLHLTSRFRWPFLRKKELTYWGHDHLYFSSGILGNNHINVIEDGNSNYFPKTTPKNYKRFQYIKELLFGKLYCLEEYMGASKACKNIYLTGLHNTVIMKNPKTIQISLKQLWKNSTIEKLNIILDSFSLTSYDLKIIKNKNIILLTQTFSEDNIISEDEKILLYKNIIKNLNHEQLIIKPHPREKTIYTKHFPNICVFTKKIPIQLLSLAGAEFKSVYTINSTAALDFPKETEINILGSKIHPNILNAYPDLA